MPRRTRATCLVALALSAAAAAATATGCSAAPARRDHALTSTRAPAPALRNAPRNADARNADARTPSSDTPDIARASASSLASSTSPSAPSPASSTSLASSTSPSPSPRRAGAYANLDPSDDLVVGPPDPHADCESELTKAGVKFRVASLPVHTPKRSKITCGAPQVVTYLRGPGNIAYNAAPFVTCSMALALAAWERILQKEATSIFGSPVARIDQLGTYNCREMAAYPGWVSEHSYANAIDIGRFVLVNGKSIEVLRDFDIGDAPPAGPAASFLRVVSRRANDEDVFSHVLTPFFDAHHKNHFHLDLARYRTDGTRPQPAPPAN